MINPTRRKFLKITSGIAAALGTGNIAGAYASNAAVPVVDAVPEATRESNLIDDLADAIDASTPNGVFTDRDKVCVMMNPSAYGNLIRGLVSSGKRDNPDFNPNPVIETKPYVVGQRLVYEAPTPHLYDAQLSFAFAYDDKWLETATGQEYQEWLHQAATQVLCGWRDTCRGHADSQVAHAQDTQDIYPFKVWQTRANG